VAARRWPLAGIHDDDDAICAAAPVERDGFVLCRT